MRKGVIAASALFVFGCATMFAAASNQTIDDSSLGLSKTSVNADSGLQTKPYAYQGNQPGDKNKRIARAYDNAPPMIPHDISEFATITKESNACIGCHMPEVAKAVGAMPVPKSHLTNLRNGKDLKGELYQGRYNCTQCHAPQAVLDPAVMNKFKGAYKLKTGGEYKTTLIETINVGVVEDKTGAFDVNKDLKE